MVYAALPLVIGDALAAILASWLLFRGYRHYTLRSTYRRLPGPRQWPLIGNVFEFPTKFEWFTYGKWGEKYGVYPSIFSRSPTKILTLLQVR